MSQSIPVVTSSDWRKNGERKEMNNEKKSQRWCVGYPDIHISANSDQLATEQEEEKKNRW